VAILATFGVGGRDNFSPIAPATLTVNLLLQKKRARIDQ